MNHPLSAAEITTYRDVLSDFIPCLNSIHTIYDSGNLHDCDNDDTELEGNKNNIRKNKHWQSLKEQHHGNNKIR